MRAFARWYARRIVNVNVNICLAAILALPPTFLAVHFSRYWGVNDDDRLIILAITWITDIIFDVAIYFGLHWMANHGSWRNKWLDKAEHLIVEPAYKGASFVHDAGIIQFQRLVLSPLLYGIWLGLGYVLMYMGMEREAALGLGWVFGIGTARVIHTLWMLRQERMAREQRMKALHLCKTCGRSLVGVTAEHCPECGALIVENKKDDKPAEGAAAERMVEPQPSAPAATGG